MRFHNQMIKKTYDHTAQIIDMLQNDSELNKVRSYAVEKNEIYRAVRNEYFCRGYALNLVDFFSDKKYFEKLVTDMTVEVQQGVGMAESNMILYNISKIIDQVMYQLRNYTDRGRGIMNIGFVGIDIEKKQLIITDIENISEVVFQLMLDRNVNTNNMTMSSFIYQIKFRFLGRLTNDSEAK